MISFLLLKDEPSKVKNNQIIPTVSVWDLDVTVEAYNSLNTQYRNKQLKQQIY